MCGQKKPKPAGKYGRNLRTHALTDNTGYTLSKYRHYRFATFLITTKQRLKTTRTLFDNPIIFLMQVL
ncbi:hypothetical protein C5O78_10475 [Treponema phagedenis]|nr:hypothetical protein C5O78_10475 [Treponema phagedenis]